MTNALIALVAAIGVALLARVPALTADGRNRAALEADIRVLEALPAGPAKEQLSIAVEQSAMQFAERRTWKTRPDRVTVRNSYASLIGNALLAVGTLAVAVGVLASNAFGNAVASATAALVALGYAVISAFDFRRAERELDRARSRHRPQPTPAGRGR